MKALDKIHEISKILAPYGIDYPEKEAEILVRSSLDIDLVELYRDNPEIKEEQTIAIMAMVNRRIKREPLQYILGYVNFLGLRLTLGREVLIPRPETELMAEKAIKKIREECKEYGFVNTDNGRRTTILDLCTGCGCLALSLAKAFPDSQAYGTDISDIAINYARRNASMNNIKNASFFHGHLFDPVNKDQLFDFIISNPPYIRSFDIKNLQFEIRDWEPLNALDGGQDGLHFYREIIPYARQFLKDNGILMLELGAGYAHAVNDMLNQANYSQIEIKRDYAGIKRIISAIKKVQWTK